MTGLNHTIDTTMAREIPARQQQPYHRMPQGIMMEQRQHLGVQAQGQGSNTGSQSQRQSGGYASQKADKTPDLQDPSSGHPIAGDQPEATDNPVGDARPVYDQYEVKSPQNMHHDAAEDAKKRAQASGQDGAEDEGTARNVDGTKSDGFGDKDDGETKHDPTTEKDVTDIEDGSKDVPDNRDSERGYG